MMVSAGHDSARFMAGLKRRRDAAQRSVPLACGHRDPWPSHRAPDPITAEGRARARDVLRSLGLYGRWQDPDGHDG